MNAVLDLTEIERSNRGATEALVARFIELEPELQVPEDQIGAFVKYTHGGALLDVGCGTAHYARRFLDLGFTYTGIDFSPAMLATARARLPGQTFREMSYRTLDFPDASFDALWSCCVLNHEPKFNMRAVLAELHRTLRPGAVMGVLLPYTGFADEVCCDVRGTDHRFYHAYWLPDELADLANATGFTVREAYEEPWCGSQMLIATA